MHAPRGVSPHTWGNCPPLSHRHPPQTAGSTAPPSPLRQCLTPPAAWTVPTHRSAWPSGGADPGDALTSRGGGTERASEGEPTHTRRAMLSTRGPAPHRHTRSARWGPLCARCSHTRASAGTLEPSPLFVFPLSVPTACFTKTLHTSFSCTASQSHSHTGELRGAKARAWEPRCWAQGRA